MAILNAEHFLRRCELPSCPQRKRAWKAWLEPGRGYFLEGRWYCSPACFEQALTAVIGEFLPGVSRPPVAPHRVPLGLLMLSRGIVDHEQLRKALKAQRDSGSGRVGEWLRHLGVVTEEQVTQILGLQWSIPVFPLNQSRRYLECALLVPFPLLEVAEMVPVHHIPSIQQLYVAFIDRINYSALYAVEKMLECHTEPCLALQSHVHRALQELRVQPQAVEVSMECISDPWQMAGSIMSHVAQRGAVDIRVSGFSGYIWARILSTSGHADMLFQAQRAQPAIYASE